MKILKYLVLFCWMIGMWGCNALDDIEDFYEDRQDEEDEFLRLVQGLTFVDGGGIYPQDNPYRLTTVDYSRSADSTVRANNGFSDGSTAGEFLPDILISGFYGQTGSFFFVRYDSVVKDEDQNILLERISVDTLAIFDMSDTSWVLSPIFRVDRTENTDDDRQYTLVREDYISFGEGGAYFDLGNNTEDDIDDHIADILIPRFYLTFEEGIIYEVTFDVLINDGVNDRIEQRIQYYEIIMNKINN
ncbi:hypothetical protein [Sediminitomix flava]|uniref:Uncharacterized protein n=1 Tax=Sediminitomix flava TaxID=379075 RepID=A0A315ZG18_SEDFL|nr:hypothetical protein [Sediminitomix flava]PWJ44262.1 hypothetical protein BC781_101612 [Sediminitomix flava]